MTVAEDTMSRLIVEFAGDATTGFCESFSVTSDWSLAEMRTLRDSVNRLSGRSVEVYRFDSEPGAYPVSLTRLTP